MSWVYSMKFGWQWQADGIGNPNAQPSTNPNGSPNPASPNPLSTLGGAGGPPAPTTSNVPYATSTIGYNGNTGLGGTQQPGIFGTGTFIANPFPINDQAITGSPTQGASTNYGLNSVMGALQSAQGSLALNNYNASAPTSSAAQGTGATGTAAQGSAALGQAAQGGASSFTGATGASSGYNPTGGTASGYGASTANAAGYGAATGGASQIGQVGGQASLGNASFFDPAQMRAAQGGGYALSGPTGISTAGDANWQQQQQQLANILGRQASGGGVSPADLQLKAGTDQQIAGQLAVLGSQRGNMGNAALATRSAADQTASSEQQLNQQMGIQRAQETIQAQQALGGVLGTGRGQAQNYNINQAGLNQQTGLFNAGNVQNSLMQGAGFQQQSNMANAGWANAANAANAGAANAMTQFDVGSQNAMTGQNMQLAQGANMYNAGNSQNMTLANLLAQNQAAQYNAGNLQSAGFQNAANLNQANQFNAGNTQAMTLADMLAANQAGQFNAGQAQNMSLANMSSANAANSQNSQQAQGMTLANMLAQNAMTGQNLGAVNTSNLANLNASNQFGLANMGNSQAAMLANLGNAQQTNLANQATLGQFGLANQSTQLAAQNQYNQQLMALLGAQTGIGQANRSASLADQQLQAQQQMAANQTNATAFDASAQANGNLTGALLNTAGTIGAAAINAASDENVKTGIEGGNPMMRSFLEQYQESQAAQAAPQVGHASHIDVGSGMAYHGPRYQKTGGGGGGGILGPILGIVGGVLGSAVAPGAGTAIGGALGSAAGGAIDSAAGMGGGGRKLVDTAGGYQPIGVTDDDTTALSDDQAKENVISGNRGMQAFLQQANAQQGAQATQGSTNNAFMQTGQAPSNAVDRQLPGSINQGYGAPQATPFPMTQQNLDGGGVSNFGGFAGGGFGGGAYQGGGYSPAGQTGAASVGGGGLAGPGSTWAGSTYGGGGWNGGWNGGGFAGGGLTQSAGITTPGGMTQGSSMTPAGVSSMGGVTPGSNASQMPQAAPPPIQYSPSAPFLNPASSAPNIGGAVASTVQPNPAAAPNSAPAWNPLNTFTAPSPVSTAPASSALTQGAAFLGGLGGSGLGVPGMVSSPIGGSLTPAAAAPASAQKVAHLRLSDENEKEAIRNPPPEKLQQFMDAIHAHQYRYKDPEAPGAGHGTFISPMAQELQKTDLGKSAVSSGPGGHLMVDYGKLGGTMLAGQAMLNERLNSHEQQLRSLLERSTGANRSQGSRMAG